MTYTGHSAFTGLSAFPITPVSDSPAGFDEASFAALVTRAAAAGVDSICALGSTGAFAYLSSEERGAVARAAVQAAGTTPVMVGVSALRTRDVLRHVADAQQAGAAAVLLAPMTYQPLTADEVFALYETITAELSVPLVVYDNPVTTGFTFTPELHGSIAALRGVASVKIPPVPLEHDAAAARISQYRAHLPSTVTLGVSGDGSAAAGLLAGCEAWYSAIAGVLPEQCLALTRAAQRGEHDLVRDLSAAFAPLWELFAAHGSYRVAVAAATHLGLIADGAIPAPVRGLDPSHRAAVARAVEHAIHT